jgi:hypothetical protein
MTVKIFESFAFYILEDSAYLQRRRCLMYSQYNEKHHLFQ